MKHPKCPLEYRVEHEAHTGAHLTYVQNGKTTKYIRIKRGKYSVANITENGKFWEIDKLSGTSKLTDFPTLDEALRYAEAKMALGILGEKE